MPFLANISSKFGLTHPTRVLILGVILLTSVFSVYAQNAANFITVREKAGVTTSNYPIQIGRPFVQGEIRNFPRAVVGTTAVTTQADVKSRWPDGSVKHAVLTFYLPTLTANSSVKVSFVNQTTGNNTNSLTKKDMLAKQYNFDARMELTNGSTVSASARAMINANAYAVWNQGSVSTSIIIADHSLARAFDIGFDANRSVRPIFHATFWPTLKKVRVRYIGEISNTTALQDQIYNLTLKLGDTKTQTVYSKTGVNHITAGRWTKEFWLGGAPPVSEIDHNLAYLKKTNALPNFDTTKQVSEAALNKAYTDPTNGWVNKPKGVFDSGNVMRGMPTAGGRDDIGPYPTWTIRWLYTGDRRAAEQTFGNAELAAAFPMHFREGLAGRTFDRNNTADALGKVLSLTARPTVVLARGNISINYGYTEAPDKIIPVGTMTDGSTPTNPYGGWIPDCAHQPDYHSPLYLLTGDYFFLEEVYFWASWSAASTNFTNVFYYGRGPTGDTGGIYDEVRGDGWTLRGRAQAAWLAPDNSPEKQYFTRLTNDAIAVWEGTLNITGTPNTGNPAWTWGNTVAVKKFSLNGNHGAAVPTLGFWEEGHPVFPDDVNVNPDAASWETSSWMHFFLVYGFGRAKELGFGTDKLLTWTSRVVTEQITDPNYNPYLSFTYQTPTVKKADNNWFNTWGETKDAFRASYDPMAELPYLMANETNHAYIFIGMTATSYCKNEPNGAAAWSFMQQNVVNAPALNDNPKWAILPR